MSKKKKQDEAKKGNRSKGAKKSGSAASAGSTAKRLKSISKNPIVADVVAAALVSMAAALKDTNKARQLAESAGDELGKLSSARSKKGNPFWDLALEVGRESLKAFSGDDKAKRSKSARKPTAKKAARNSSR